MQRRGSPIFAPPTVCERVGQCVCVRVCVRERKDGGREGRRGEGRAGDRGANTPCGAELCCKLKCQLIRCLLGGTSKLKRIVNEAVFMCVLCSY